VSNFDEWISLFFFKIVDPKKNPDKIHKKMKSTHKRQYFISTYQKKGPTNPH